MVRFLLSFPNQERFVLVTLNRVMYGTDKIENLRLNGKNRGSHPGMSELVSVEYETSLRSSSHLLDPGLLCEGSLQKKLGRPCSIEDHAIMVEGTAL